MIADGTCVIDIFVPVDVPGRREEAKWNEIARATRAILSTCVVRPRFDGGYVNKVGTLNFFSLVKLATRSTFCIRTHGTDKYCLRTIFEPYSKNQAMN